jgi:DNA-binding NtrC family response regulator
VEVQIRVLLVEDDAPLRRSLEKFLRQAGYSLCSCCNAREALVEVEKFHPDILIAEYHLPDANGAVLLERLTRFVPHAATVLISEYDYQSVADEIVQVDVHAFLKKPFDLAELETVLSSACCQMRILMRNLKWNADPVFKEHLPPLTRRKLSEISGSSGVHAED